MQSLRMQLGDGITDLCHGSLVPLDVRRVACGAGEWHETSFDGRFEAFFFFLRLSTRHLWDLHKYVPFSAEI